MRQIGENTPVGTIVTEKTVYDNPFFRVVERVVQTPDGQTREPHLLWDRGGKRFAIAAAITADNQIVLVREPKYGQMDTVLTLATGGIEKGEDPFVTAQRELRSESGYVANPADWITLIGNSEDSFIDFADKVDGAEHFVYLATHAVRVEVEPPERYRQAVLLSKADFKLMMTNPSSSPYKLRIAMSRAAAALVVAIWDW